MDTSALDAVVGTHFGFEAADDVDGVLSTLTEDVRHHVVGSSWGPLVGRDAARPFYEQLFADLKGTGVTPVRRWYGENFLVDETDWTGWVGDGRVFGLPGQSGTVTFRLLHVFDFRDGLISAETVYVDLANLAAQLEQG